MSRAWATLREIINPDSAHHRAVPPMEGGLRPNSRLDGAPTLLSGDGHELDDMASVGDAVWFSSGSQIHSLTADGKRTVVADCGAVVTALAALGPSSAVAAVEGIGLVSVDGGGAITEVCTDQVTQTCVTALTTHQDGRIVVSVGSRKVGPGGWAMALVSHDRSGLLVTVDGHKATVAAEGLAWPSGVSTDGDSVLVSLSHGHRIERRPSARLGQKGQPVVSNLPVYPGRIVSAPDGWWVAAPYVRNRMTELLLDEPDVLNEMIRTVPQRDWFVPLVRPANPFTQSPQMGNVRVLNVVKPWAPARSYGMVFRIDARGRIVESAQSRVDGERHGVTSVTVDRRQRVLAAAQGYGNILELTREKS